MDHCSLCKQEIPEGPEQVWTSPQREPLRVPTGTTVSALVGTSIGELEICEKCYSALPSYFISQDLYEIHFQFGLEYRDRENHVRSAEALRHAISIKPTADALSALADAEDHLGNRERAMSLYEQALSLDPNNFMAHENLKVMKKSPPAGGGLHLEDPKTPQQ